MKKIISTALAVLMILGTAATYAVSAEDEAASSSPSAFTTTEGLYVHAVLGSNDADAWQKWQCAHDEDFNTPNYLEKYFFLPSSADNNTVDIWRI